MPEDWGGDLGELFCALFDRARSGSESGDPHLAAGSAGLRELQRWLATPEAADVTTLARTQAVTQGHLGDAPRHVVTAGVREAVAVLVGLDQAFRLIHPGAGGPSYGGLDYLVVKYLSTGTLYSSKTHGALLFRWAEPANEPDEPGRLDDLFRSVVRVTADMWRGSRFINLSHVAFTPKERDEDFAVAASPVISDLSEFRFQKRAEDGISYYRVSPIESIVSSRAPLILDALDRSGAIVGVLPELTLTRRQLSRWKALLRTTAVHHGSRLRLLLIGTGRFGTGRGVNRAYLLDRHTGEELAQQDKMHPFKLTSDQLRHWHLARRLGAGARNEHIDRGAELKIVETRIGRMAILICQDLSRTRAIWHAVDAFGVSMLLIPIFSKEVRRHRWEESNARRYADEVGTSIVVANSLAVARAISPNAGPWGSALVLVPEHPDAVVGTTTRGDDVVKFLLRDGSSSPPVAVVV